MKRMILSGLSLIALTAVAAEAIATPLAINRISANTNGEALQATRHRDSSLPNPVTFPNA